MKAVKKVGIMRVSVAATLSVLPVGCASALTPAAENRSREAKATVIAAVSRDPTWKSADRSQRVSMLWQYSLDQERKQEFELAALAIREMIKIDKSLEGDSVLVVKLVTLHNKSVAALSASR